MDQNVPCNVLIVYTAENDHLLVLGVPATTDITKAGQLFNAAFDKCVVEGDPFSVEQLACLCHADFYKRVAAELGWQWVTEIQLPANFGSTYVEGENEPQGGLVEIYCMPDFFAN